MTQALTNPSETIRDSDYSTIRDYSTSKWSNIFVNLTYIQNHETGKNWKSEGRGAEKG